MLMQLGKDFAPRSSFLSRVRLYLKNPMVWVALLLVFILIYLAVVPLYMMMSESLHWQISDTRLRSEAEPGKFTYFHWWRMLGSEMSQVMFYQPLWNTILISVGSSLLALIIGIGLAWLVARTNLPGRKFVTWLAPLPYMMPSWYLALAWLVVFKNDRVGGSMGLFQYLSGFAPPDWVSYGPFPIIITLGIYLYPFVFLLVVAALSSFDSSLEEAALVQGATYGNILRKITFPLVLPAIFSSFILIFSRALGTFGIPQFLGFPVGFNTLPTLIYANINNRQGSDAYVIVFFLILIAAITIFFNQKVISGRRNYATITGKGMTVRPMPLGKMRWPIFSLVGFFFLLAVLLPLLLLAWQSLMKVDGNYQFSNLTMRYWIGNTAHLEPGLLRNPDVFRILLNTLKIALYSGIICSFFGVIIGYLVIRMKGQWLSQMLEQSAFLPYLIPSIAFGAIYLVMFAKPLGPIPALYGTLTLLVLVSVVKYLPMAFRSGTSAMIQVGKDLEEAAIVQGAGWWRRFTRILLPITKAGAITGFLFTFISAMKELSLVVILITPQTATLNTLTYRYAEIGYSQYSDAIILVIIFFIFVANFLARRLGGKNSSKGLVV